MYGRNIKILRLPVGHSELNPIELIWAQVKSEVARKNTMFKITDVKYFMNNALQGVTGLNWSKAINNVRGCVFEGRFWRPCCSCRTISCSIKVIGIRPMAPVLNIGPLEGI